MFEKLCALKNKKGFTLIEMLVVIAIIAVLVAIAVPVVSSSTTKAKAATDAANLRTAMSEANIYVITNNIPVAETDLTENVSLKGTKSKQNDALTIKVTMSATGELEAIFSNADGSTTLDLDDCLAAAGEGTAETPES